MRTGILPTSLAVFMLATAMALPASAEAEIIYRETFSNTVGQTSLPSFGWYAYYGNATTNAAVAVPGSSGVPATAMASGGPSAGTLVGSTYTFESDVNAGAPGPYPSATNSNGFVTTPCMYGQYDILVYTSEYVIDRSTYSVNSFSFYATSAGTFLAGESDTVYAVIQIAGTWYVSTLGVMPVLQTDASGVAFQTTALTLPITFDSSAGSWSLLNFSPGSAMTIGDVLTTALPDGDITAFGLLWDLGATSDRNTPRWDTFAIDADVIPEPLTLALLAVGSVTTLLRKRRTLCR